MNQPSTQQIVLQNFARDVAGHTMEVLLDSGLHRHLSFTKGGSSIYRFDLITVPGALTIKGDMGCYTFQRMADMFEFFASPIGYVNEQYWGEKLTSISRNGGYEEFSHARYATSVRSMVEDKVSDFRKEVLAINAERWEQYTEELEYAEDGDEPITEPELLSMADSLFDLESLVRYDLIGDEYESLSSNEIYRRLNTFKATLSTGYAREDISTEISFDVYDLDVDFTEYSVQYLWCLHAIVYGIACYRAGQMIELEQGAGAIKAASVVSA